MDNIYLFVLLTISRIKSKVKSIWKYTIGAELPLGIFFNPEFSRKSGRLSGSGGNDRTHIFSYQNVTYINMTSMSP